MSQSLEVASMSEDTVLVDTFPDMRAEFPGLIPASVEDLYAVDQSLLGLGNSRTDLQHMPLIAVVQPPRVESLDLFQTTLDSTACYLMTRLLEGAVKAYLLTRAVVIAKKPGGAAARGFVGWKQPC
tara:strand:- start:14170 stop:14547 length:378 start_codon:yes stop_codon:yes gene_type:complete